VVELQDGDRAVDIEHDVLELHLFPHGLWSALLLPRRKGFRSRSHI
jgi:hypothetical protein